MWILPALLSSLFLGLYEVLKKLSLRGRKTLSVLMLTTMISAILMLPEGLYFFSSLSLELHLKILLKSFFVACSWLCGFWSLQRLPISVAAPILSTGPLFTSLAGFLVLHERPSLLQCVGILLFLVGIYLLQLASRRESVHFSKNAGILIAILGVLFGTLSGLLDKTLMGMHFSHLLPYQKAVALQAWFSLYMPFWIGISTVLYRFRKKEARSIWPIVPLMQKIQILKKNLFAESNLTSPAKNGLLYLPLLSISLLAADRAYFMALSDPDGLLSIVTCTRRSSILIPVLLGGLLFKEKNLFRKTLAALVIASSLMLLLLG